MYVNSTRLVLVICLYITVIERIASRSESEARTECVAGCLKVFKLQVLPGLRSIFALHPDRINRECGKAAGKTEAAEDQEARNRCHTCTHTCNHYGTQRYKSQSSCHEFCQTVSPSPKLINKACNETCNKLKTLRVTNQGKCPRSPVKQTGTTRCQAAGFSCNPKNDKTCHGLTVMKCCPGACGFSCTPSNLSEPAVPPIPSRPVLRRKGFKTLERKAIEVDWSTYNISLIHDPIVFLIQFKSHKSYRFDESIMSASRWQDLAITTRTALEIEDLEIGSWYQIRLAAISAEGFLGYSKSSDPIKLSREPKRPSEVRELQEGISRVHDNKIDIQILWKPPKNSDLPIAKYEIKWVERLGFTGEKSLTKFETQVPGTATEYYLPNLKPAATYQINVWAIAYYGPRIQLKSKKSIIYVNTMKLPHISIVNRDAVNKQTSDSIESLANKLPDCSCRDKPETNIVTKTPYFQNGDLRALILWSDPSGIQAKGGTFTYVNTFLLTWTQRVCIESTTLRHGNRATREAAVHNQLVYTLTGLKFDCHYFLQVKGLTFSGQVAFTWDTCFCTPSCKETTIKGSQVPNCPVEEEIHVPQPPINLQFTIIDPMVTKGQSQEEKRYVAKINWGAPEILYAIKGFRITWGPRLYEEVNPILYSRGLEPKIDTELSDTRILDARQRQFYLPGLRPATIYIARIQTLTVFGDSASRSLYFATPGGPSHKRKLSQEVQKYINRSGVALSSGRQLLSLCLSVCLHWWWWRDIT